MQQYYLVRVEITFLTRVSYLDQILANQLVGNEGINPAGLKFLDIQIRY